jgi:hypothetical protein
LDRFYCTSILYYSQKYIFYHEVWKKISLEL